MQMILSCQKYHYGHFYTLIIKIYCFLFSIFVVLQFYYSSRAFGLHFHLSLCDSGAEIEFARLQRKEKAFKENTGLLLLRNNLFASSYFSWNYTFLFRIFWSSQCQNWTIWKIEENVSLTNAKQQEREATRKISAH